MNLYGSEDDEGWSLQYNLEEKRLLAFAADDG